MFFVLYFIKVSNAEAFDAKILSSPSTSTLTGVNVGQYLIGENSLLSKGVFYFLSDCADTKKSCRFAAGLFW